MLKQRIFTTVGKSESERQRQTYRNRKQITERDIDRARERQRQRRRDFTFKHITDLQTSSERCIIVAAKTQLQ